MSPDPGIRKAGPADLDALVSLSVGLQDHLEASNPSLWRMTPETRDRLRSQWAARLAAPAVCVLVAEVPGAGVAGMGSGRIAINDRYEPHRAGTVEQLFVVAEQRRHGLGRRLVAGLLRFFEAEGVDDISLRYVTGNEEAEGFWAALGFAPRIVTAGATRRAVQERLDNGWCDGEDCDG